MLLAEVPQTAVITIAALCGGVIGALIFFLVRESHIDKQLGEINAKIDEESKWEINKNGIHKR